jgi:hypothetical protein
MNHLSHSEITQIHSAQESLPTEKETLNPLAAFVTFIWKSGLQQAPSEVTLLTSIRPCSIVSTTIDRGHNAQRLRFPKIRRDVPSALALLTPRPICWQLAEHQAHPLWRSPVLIKVYQFLTALRGCGQNLGLLWR